MKTINSTTACLLLFCSILVEQGVADHSSTHHNGVSHHRDTSQKKHHSADPMDIQMPHHVLSTAEVSCISADDNIFEIMNKANASCRGNDTRCTFYHYSNHKYHNLGTFDIDKGLFDALLKKYDHWLLTAKKIDEINSEHSSYKARLKESNVLDVKSVDVRDGVDTKIDNTSDSVNVEDRETSRDLHTDKVNHNMYDFNVIHDTNNSDEINTHNTVNPSETYHRKHHDKVKNTKLTNAQRQQWKNGNIITLNPKLNNKHKYFEVFLPKDKNKGEPRTIYVDINGDKNEYVLFDEAIEKELENDTTDKPIKIELEEFSTGTDTDDEESFSVHDRGETSDANTHIAVTEDNGNIEVKEYTQKYLNPSVSNTNINSFNDNDVQLDDHPDSEEEYTELVSTDDENVVNDNTITDVDYIDSESDTSDDDSHIIQLLETNSHHDDLNSDNNNNYSYKRSDTLHLKEPIFHVEKPLKENNMHIFSLPEYTGHHSDGISDYIGYLDSISSRTKLDHSVLRNPPSIPDVSSSHNTIPIFGTELAEISETDPHLQYVNGQVFPGYASFYSPKVTSYNTPFSSHDIESSPTFSVEPIPRPNFSLKYPPFNFGLKSSTSFSPAQEMRFPFVASPLIQNTAPLSQFSSPNEEYSVSNLDALPPEPFEGPSLYRRLPSVSTEPSFTTYPCPSKGFTTSSMDTSNMLPKSNIQYDRIPSNLLLTERPSPMIPKLGAKSYPFQQIPLSLSSPPVTKFNREKFMDLGLIKLSPLNTSSGKPIYNQNMFSPPSRNRYQYPYKTPQFTYPCLETTPTASFLPASEINSRPLAVGDFISIPNENRFQETTSKSLLSITPISPLRGLLQRPILPCPKPATTVPYHQVPLQPHEILLDKYQHIGKDLTLDADVQQDYILEPCETPRFIPLSIVGHPYSMTSSSYIPPARPDLYPSLTLDLPSPAISQYGIQPTIISEKELLKPSEIVTSYSDIPYPSTVSEKSCLSLQNQPLIPILDGSLIGDHLPTLSPINPILGKQSQTGNSELTFQTDVSNLTILDSSLIGPELDSNHIETNTVSSLIDIPKTGDQLVCYNQETNVALESVLTGPGLETVSPVDLVANNKIPNTASMMEVAPQLTLHDQPTIPQFENCLEGADLPLIPLDIMVSDEVQRQNKELFLDPSLANLIPLESSKVDLQIQNEQSQNKNTVSPDICEPVQYLPSNLLEKEKTLESEISPLKPLDSSLIDTQLNFVTKSANHELKPSLDNLQNTNILPSSLIPPSLELPIQADVNLKPIPEKPQLLDELSEPALDTNILSNMEQVEIPLTDTAPLKETVTQISTDTNKETDYHTIEELSIENKTIPTLEDSKTMYELESPELIPILESKNNNLNDEVNIIQSSDLLPVDELNRPIIDPNLRQKIESLDITPCDLNLENSLIGPSILQKNPLSVILSPSDAAELESSFIRPSLEDETVSNIDTETSVTCPSIGISSENVDLGSSLKGPSLVQETEMIPVLNSETILDSTLIGSSLPQEENFLEIVPTVESEIKLGSNLVGPSLFKDKDLAVTIPVLEPNIVFEHSLIGPSLHQNTEAPEIAINLNPEVKLDSTLIGPSLFQGTNLPEILPILESDLTLNNIFTCQNSQNELISQEYSPILHSESVLDSSLLGPDLTTSTILNDDLSQGFDQTNSVFLDSSLIDTLVNSVNGLDLSDKDLSELSSSLVCASEVLPSNFVGYGIPSKPAVSAICSNPLFNPNLISNSHINIQKSLPLSSLIGKQNPSIGYSQLRDLYIPNKAIPSYYTPQSAFPSKDLFPSTLRGPILKSQIIPRPLNLPSSNIVNQNGFPLYVNPIPCPTIYSQPKLLPLYNIPNTPLSRPIITPEEYSYIVTKPVTQNQQISSANNLLNTPIYLKGDIPLDQTFTGQEFSPQEHILPSYQPTDRNVHTLPNNYWQPLNSIPFNMQLLNSNIPCVPQKHLNTLSPSAQINWQQPELLPVASAQNIQPLPILKPVTNDQVLIPSTFLPLSTDDSKHLLDLNSEINFNAQSNIDNSIFESEYNPILPNDLKSVLDKESFQFLNDMSMLPYEEYHTIPADEIDEYMSQANSFTKPLHVAKARHDQQGVEFTTEPETVVLINNPMEMPAICPPKYRPKTQKPIYSELLNEDIIPTESQWLAPQKLLPCLPQKSILQLPTVSNELLDSHPYDILPTPFTLPPSFLSPVSFARPMTALNTPLPQTPYLVNPHLLQSTSPPVSVNLPTSGQPKCILPDVPYKPLKTYPGSYLPIHSSPSLIDTNDIPTKAMTSPNLSSYTHATPVPSFRPGTQGFSPYSAPLKPISSTPLMSTPGFELPSYVSSVTPTYSNSPLSPTNILSGSLNLLTPMSYLPCVTPLPETSPILNPQIANSQLLREMNILPISKEIKPFNNANGETPISPIISQTTSYSTQISEPISLTTQTSQMYMDDLQQNELSEAVLESNLQQLETVATPGVWTTYNEENICIYSNVEDDKFYEDLKSQTPFESIPNTLEPEEISDNLLNEDFEQIDYIPEAPVSAYGTEPVLQSNLYQRNHPTSYSQAKELFSSPSSIETIPQISSDIPRFLPLSSTINSPVLQPLPGLSKPLLKPLSPVTPAFKSQSFKLPSIPNFHIRPPLSPSPMLGSIISPYENKLESLSLSSPSYHPAITQEVSKKPTTTPSIKYVPSVPLSPSISNILENIVSLEATPYLSSTSPIPPYTPTKLPPYSKSPIHNGPLPTSLLPLPLSDSKLQSSPITFQDLQLKPLTLEHYTNIVPIAKALPLKEYMPISQSLTQNNAPYSPPYVTPLLPVSPIKPSIPSPCTKSTIPNKDNLQLKAPPIYYEPYYNSMPPGRNSSPKYSNIVEFLPTTVSPSFDKIVRPVKNKLSSPYNALYSSPPFSFKEPIETIPCSPTTESILPQNTCHPKSLLSLSQYTMPSSPSSPLTSPLVPSNSYQTQPFTNVEYISKPILKADPAKHTTTYSSYDSTLDTNPCQLKKYPYVPENRVQSSANVQYITEPFSIPKPVPAQYTETSSSHNSLPLATNIKLPCLLSKKCNVPVNPIEILNPSSVTLTNPFMKSDFKVGPMVPAYSVPTKVISSPTITPVENNVLSHKLHQDDDTRNYFVPYSSPKAPLYSSSLLKPLKTSGLPITKEIPIECKYVNSPTVNVPQFISPNSPLLKPLLTNPFIPSPLIPQHRLNQRPVLPETDLSKHQPIISSTDEDLNPNDITVSELPAIVPPSKTFLTTPFKLPFHSRYQSPVPTDRLFLTPTSVAPVSTEGLSSSTSNDIETSPLLQTAQPLPTLNVRPTFSTIVNPSFRPAISTPTTTHYGSKSLLQNTKPAIENISPIETPSYSQQTILEPSPWIPVKANNIEMVNPTEVAGLPISDLLTLPSTSNTISPSQYETPKTSSKYQNSLPEYPTPWVLLNNADIDDDTITKLTSPMNSEPETSPYVYESQISEMPLEVEYLKAKPLSELEIPYTKFETYTDLKDDIKYVTSDDNDQVTSDLPKDYTTLSKTEPNQSIIKNIALNLAQKQQSLPDSGNFYANNHIGKSPLVFSIDPRYHSLPKYSFVDQQLPKATDSDINRDYIGTTNNNLNLVPELDSTLLPNEYVPYDTNTDAMPVSNSNDLSKPTFTHPPMKNLPETTELLSDNPYYRTYDNIENIKYSGYKTYQIPTLKSSQNPPNIGIPSQVYYPTQNPSISASIISPADIIPTLPHIPTMIPGTIIPEYQIPIKLSTPQTKLEPNNLPQSPNFNEYNPIDNFNGNNEIKNSVVNYINKQQGLKDILYNNNNVELTIPIGNIAITKKEPQDAKTIQTNNPSIGLKVWKSNIKLIQAELKLKFNEMSVNNFMPIINNLNEYDAEEIRKIIKSYIDKKYGEHIEVNEPYTADNQYTVIKDLNQNVKDNQFNLLWPTYYI